MRSPTIIKKKKKRLPENQIKFLWTFEVHIFTILDNIHSICHVVIFLIYCNSKTNVYFINLYLKTFSKYFDSFWDVYGHLGDYLLYFTFLIEILFPSNINDKILMNSWSLAWIIWNANVRIPRNEVLRICFISFL